MRGDNNEEVSKKNKEKRAKKAAGKAAKIKIEKQKQQKQHEEREVCERKKLEELVMFLAMHPRCNLLLSLRKG